ncbi:outer membrane protein [Erythrobacter sp. R86502]|uniref:outer membrane protein n=1 Tax=Erythrobacter sp. R86502 TaxID=3093846 RepID=UPI0036D3D7D5
MNLAKTMSLSASVAALTMSTAAFAQTEDRFFDGPYIAGSVGLETPDDSGNDRLVFDTNGDGDFNNTVATVAGADAFSPGFCAGSAVSAASAGCRGNELNEGYSLRIGYDRHLGNGPVVAGLLIEGSRPGVEEFTTGFSTTPASYTIGREIDWAANVRGRIGVAPGAGRALFYATGGVGFAKIDHTFTTSNGANSFTPTDSGDWEFGWQAGGGAEVMITENLGLGLEYLYSRYNDDDYSVAVGQGTAPATNPFLLVSGGTDLRGSNENFDYHAVRASVSLRF